MIILQVQQFFLTVSDFSDYEIQLSNHMKIAKMVVNPSFIYTIERDNRKLLSLQTTEEDVNQNPKQPTKNLNQNNLYESNIYAVLFEEIGSYDIPKTFT